MKQCSLCKEKKRIDAFNRRKSHKDGLRSECRDCQRKSAQTYRTDHRDKANESSRKYRRANPEKRRVTNRNWNRNNPDKAYQYVKNNRSKHKISRGLTSRRRARIFVRDEGICKLCLTYIDSTLAWPDLFSLSIDHIIPRCKGGQNTDENLQSTHLICNLKKGGEYDYQGPGT